MPKLPKYEEFNLIYQGHLYELDPDDVPDDFELPVEGEEIEFQLKTKSGELVLIVGKVKYARFVTPLGTDSLRQVRIEIV